MNGCLYGSMVSIYTIFTVYPVILDIQWPVGVHLTNLHK